MNVKECYTVYTFTEKSGCGNITPILTIIINIYLYYQNKKKCEVIRTLEQLYMRVNIQG